MHGTLIQPRATVISLTPPRTVHATFDVATHDRAALAAASDPIITIDARGIIQSASDSVRRVLGWSADDLVGRSARRIFADPFRSSHHRDATRMNPMKWPARCHVARKDGSVAVLEMRVSRAELPAGDGPLFVALLRDVSSSVAAERQQAKELLHAQHQLAEQTSALDAVHMRRRVNDRMASIGTLAAGLGHDMSNVLLPVRAHLNALKALMNTGAWTAACCKHVEEICGSVAYLQQLADGLHFLALDPDTAEDARGGGASTDLHAWWLQAGPLLSKAVPKHVRVTASLPDGLPHAALAAHGLTQAILNLIVNAGEAIPRARKRRQGLVHVHAEEEKGAGGDWLRLNVCDNGLGMSPEVQRRAFEMFFTTKPRGLGTGLGLALVRKIVQRAHGRIEIHSELGKGTAVSLLLPVSRPPASSAVVEKAATAVVAINDQRLAAFVCQMMEAWGVRVCTEMEPEPAEIWVVSPSAARVNMATRWRERHPRGRLLLFGNPATGTEGVWEALHGVAIHDPNDLDSVCAALSRALAPAAAGREERTYDSQAPAT